MSNHYHVVLRVDAERAAGLADDEVLARWTRLFTGPMLVQRYLQPAARAAMGEAERAKVQEMAAIYRQRLCDLSWFMRVLNESIARQANAEDGVKGHFWEGRFKSQALLDEQALLAAMAYVDLNPIRAGMAETLEDSAHTSIAARLAELQGRPFVPVPAPRPPQTAAAAGGEPGVQGAPPGALRLPSLRPEQDLAALPEAPLMPFDPTGGSPGAVPWGRGDPGGLGAAGGGGAPPHRGGSSAAPPPAVLQRLGMDAQAFISAADPFFRSFASAVGTPAQLLQWAAHRQQRAMRGMAAARQVFARRAA